MKKSVILSVAIASILFSCSNGGKTPEQLQHEADSLKIETAEAQRDSLLTLVGQINESLSEVNRMENILVSPDFKSETPSEKQQILRNIAALKQELANRKEQLNKLEARMKKSGKYNAELQKTIDSQKKLIEEQQAKIDDMTKQLADANIKIEELSSNVDSLTTTVTNVTAEKEAAEERTEAVTNELNTCYYVVGSNKELKEHKILEKKFLSKTKVLEGDFDRNYFTQADKRTLTKINTFSKNAKIMTKQPVGSYTITEEDGKKVINITNATLFWEKSNFLVIQID